TQWQAECRPASDKLLQPRPHCGLRGRTKILLSEPARRRVRPPRTAREPAEESPPYETGMSWEEPGTPSLQRRARVLDWYTGVACSDSRAGAPALVRQLVR